MCCSIRTAMHLLYCFALAEPCRFLAKAAADGSDAEGAQLVWRKLKAQERRTQTADVSVEDSASGRHIVAVTQGQC